MSGPSKTSMTWTRVIGTLLVLGYPLAVYLGVQSSDVRTVGLAVLVLLVPGMALRVRGVERARLGAALGPLIPAAGLVAIAVVIEDARFLLLVPVLVSALLLMAFVSTLRPGRQSMIERFARLQDAALPEGGVAYCRSVTWVWCGFFVVNGVVAGVLALTSVTWWALYTGAIAYALIGLLFTVEYVVRKARFRQFGNGLHDRALARIFRPPADAAPG